MVYLWPLQRDKLVQKESICSIPDNFNMKLYCSQYPWLTRTRCHNIFVCFIFSALSEILVMVMGKWKRTCMKNQLNILQLSSQKLLLCSKVLLILHSFWDESRAWLSWHSHNVTDYKWQLSLAWIASPLWSADNEPVYFELTFPLYLMPASQVWPCHNSVCTAVMDVS